MLRYMYMYMIDDLQLFKITTHVHWNITLKTNTQIQGTEGIYMYAYV